MSAALQRLFDFLLKQARYRQSFPEAFFGRTIAEEDPKLLALMEAKRAATKALDEYVVAQTFATKHAQMFLGPRVICTTDPIPIPKKEE